MDNKYKDRDPYETIRIAKQFLLRNGILVWENWIHDKVGLFTVRIIIDGTNIGVNGKGTSRVYALASAYGELMERLQNMTHFCHYTDFMVRDKTLYKNHTTAPIASYPELMDRIIGTMPEHAVFPYDLDNLTKITRLRYGEDDTMRCLVLDEVGGDTTLTIPMDLVIYYYTSNGMVAGNTLEEAYVQGLSEVLERYTARTCYTQKLTPPDLDEGLLRSLDNYSDVMTWIARIEEAGRYKIRLLDFSLGHQLPVIALILYDTTTASYFVKAGSHPRLEIAIERCFTELMQGKRIDNYQGVMTFSENKRYLARDENILQFFIDGQGAFYPSFFSRKASWNPSLQKNEMTSNREMADHLVGCIHRLGFRIFVHDCTVSDIPAYHFFVPGMSEVIGPEEASLENYRRKYEVSDLLKSKVDRLEPGEARFIIDYLDQSTLMTPDKPATKLLTLTAFQSPNPYEDTPILLFKYYLHMVCGDYPSAVACLKEYAALLAKKSRKNMYIDCLISLLYMVIDGMDQPDIEEILSQFYQPNAVKKALDDFKAYPLRQFSPYLCDYDCRECYWSESCMIKHEKAVYEKLKPAMTEAASYV